MKSKIIVSDQASKKLIDYFLDKNLDVKLFKKMDKPYESVSSHPDMFMFFDDVLFLEADVEINIKNIIKCEEIGKKYPENIKYNIVKVGNHIICKKDNISKIILEHLLKKKYNIIDTKQGYAKCSTCIVDENSIITSDKNIEKVSKKSGIDVLLIKPGYIKLKGLDYGFIGGASVSFDNIVFFNGNIKEHPDYLNIKEFIEQKNKIIEYLDYPLEDLGSFIILDK